MAFADARIVSRAEARALILPHLAARMPRRDADLTLDIELGLADDAGEDGVLLLPFAADCPRDLVLDYDVAVHGGQRYRGILAPGSLTVEGGIRNDDIDGGPFLVVLGCLSVRHVIKGGAPLICFGPLVSPGVVYCQYNHGSFRAYGGIAAQGIVIEDQRYAIAGPVSGVRLVVGKDDAVARLLPEFFAAHGANLELVADFGRMLEGRIRRGEPVFRRDAPD